MKILKLVCLCIIICIALYNTETLINIKRVRKIAPIEWLMIIIPYISVVLVLIMNIL